MNNGTSLRPRRRSIAGEVTAAGILLAVLSPALAAPLGLAWRVLKWAAGTP